MCKFRSVVASLVLAGCLAGVQSGAKSYGRPSDDGLAANDEQHFSRLSSINTNSILRLGLAWSQEFDSTRGMEAMPLVVDDVLFTTTAWSKVYAFNAGTGMLLWSYDPKVPGETGFKACCDVVNRGPAYSDGKVFVATLDGRLIALDAKSGKLVWSTVTVDQSKPYTITGAPRIAKGRVLIGNGGAEYGVRGYISAYDAATGALAWRFYTVPSAKGAPADRAASDSVMDRARATWSGDYGKLGGGGTVWDAITYDPATNLVFFGTGNGTPWDEKLRSPGGGDNLFIASIVAVNADSGEYKWHYQTTPGDVWDFDAAENMTLADLTINRQPHKVLMQASKNGYFYVIDRSDGRLLSAQNFVPQNWSAGIDIATGRPIEVPKARYGDNVFVAAPSGNGAHSWQPMAFSPTTGLVYIPAQEVPLAYTSSHPFVETPGGWNTGVDWSANVMPDDDAGLKTIRALLKGYLLAWDPIAQKEVWRAPHAGPWNGGVLATDGGLIFQGNAKGELVAFAADHGKRLWSFDTGIGIVAAPITYAVKGRQYLAIMAGYGGGYAQSSPFAENAGPRPKGRLLVFALDAHLPYHFVKTPSPPAVVVTDIWSKAVHDKGASIFANTCSLCHGATARSSGLMPDLRRSGVLASKEAWQAVVIGGALKDRGMIGFGTWLTTDDAEAVRAYVAERARHLAQQGN